MHSAHATSSPFESERRELQRCVEDTPKDATVKGMFIDSFLKTLDGARIPRPTDKRFVSFRDYPLTSFMDLMLSSTAAMYPSHAPREGLRLMGQLGYPTFASSTVGRVIFSLAGRSWEAALPLASRAYEVSLTPGRATLTNITPNTATLELREVWNFADTYQVGVFEGAMQTFNIEGQVKAVKRGKRCDVDLFLEWE